MVTAVARIGLEINSSPVLGEQKRRIADLTEIYGVDFVSSDTCLDGI